MKNKIKLFLSNYRTIRDETGSSWLAFKLSIIVLLKKWKIKTKNY